MAQPKTDFVITCNGDYRETHFAEPICINNLSALITSCIYLHQLFIFSSISLHPFLPGAIQFVFRVPGTESIIIACAPPVFYILVCFITKANTQITIAAIMSILYAFLMTASFFSIIGG